MMFINIFGMIGKAQQIRRSQGKKTYMSRGQNNPLGQYKKLLSDYEKGEPLLTIGPNYIFFLVCFLVANLISLITIVKLSHDERVRPFFYLSIVVLVYLDVVWLTTALVNPGILIGSGEKGDICQKCLDYGRQVSVSSGTVHCQSCEVCVQEQVMHFRLVGGCIGKNNFIAFKLLILGIFLWCLSLLTIIPQLLHIY